MIKIYFPNISMLAAMAVNHENYDLMDVLYTRIGAKDMPFAGGHLPRNPKALNTAGAVLFRELQREGKRREEEESEKEAVKEPDEATIKEYIALMQKLGVKDDDKGNPTVH